MPLAECLRRDVRVRTKVQYIKAEFAKKDVELLGFIVGSDSETAVQKRVINTTCLRFI